MQRIRTALAAAGILALTAGAASAAEFTHIVLEKDIAAPAEAVWKKVGDFCALRDWLKVSCKILSGDGGIGTVRSVRDTVTEVMVGKTALSYTYSFVDGKDMYHGTIEIVPRGANASKAIYTLFWDQEPLKTPEAKAQSREGRAKRFGEALDNIKAMGEAK